ncbi:hypothetical protein E2C01_008586 [Portunus trituberculatus]|uniref:Uncharacterized protein n=1 Tax=Portunus trituberculatus TaxID=210409 RepID=A0A5B7D5J1_PORTR|nr:hypothetical protein [Portunus trituberculatus]
MYNSANEYGEATHNLACSYGRPKLPRLSPKRGSRPREEGRAHAYMRHHTRGEFTCVRRSVDSATPQAEHLPPAALHLPAAPFSRVPVLTPPQSLSTLPSNELGHSPATSSPESARDAPSRFATRPLQRIVSSTPCLAQVL